MMTTTRMVLVGLTLLATSSTIAQAPKPKRLPAGWDRLKKPAGHWLGQDGHDVAGPSSVEGGSDIQDIHIALGGLPKGRAIVAGIVQGLGGDDWHIHGPHGPWAAIVKRKPGASTADLFLEPARVETGRAFTIKLTFEGGQGVEFHVKGGRADPDRRMPGTSIVARWIGQDGPDRVGLGPSVGPDGLRDVRIELAKVSTAVEIKSVMVRAKGKGGPSWQSGVNPEGLDNAELVRRDDRSHADLYIQPARDLAGGSLTITLTYVNDKSDTCTVPAGRVDPTSKVAKAPPPRIEPIALEARWLGQDGTGGSPGDVHVTFDGLPRDREIVAAMLTDPVRGRWVHRAKQHAPIQSDPWDSALALRRSADRTSADLHFAPDRDESRATLTLRLIFADGRTSVSQFEGGPCDVALRADVPDPTRITAKPGDDLHNLVNKYGSIKLSKGSYSLSRPLVLSRPITIEGEPGATLLFAQEPDAPTWTAAIKVHRGRTTLDGFAVRFAGPIRWTPDTQYGPAVIGTTDNHDKDEHGLKVGLVFRRLDLESPPVSSKWEEAPRLIRLATAQCGRIEGNTLKGGMVEFFHGPWNIADNVSRGTVENSVSPAVFSGHSTFDLVLRNNVARPVAPHGKTWRFLVLAQRGANDVIRENTVVGIGPRDDDTIPSQNAPEIVLTESYRLHFEGKPTAVSPDGRVLVIPEPQGEPAGTGDVVAILSGPHAGQWKRIAQRMDARTYLMESPLPPGDAVVSIASGFVNETFESNTIDGRGSAVAVDLMLVGNHFGTRVVKNHLLGAGAFRITAAPTEQPVHWGWSHAPSFGLVVEGNTIEDSLHGGTLSVEHGPAVKSSRGRVYLTATLGDTTVRWSEAFLKGKKTVPEGLTVGEPGSLDAGEMRVACADNRAIVSSGSKTRPTLRISGACVDGVAIIRREAPLPLAPK